MARKLNRTYLYILISSLALVIVLFIQVSWILTTAEVKEQLFNEKANMVLSKTVEALSADSEACGSLEDGDQGVATYKIDSLFSHYMKMYNIRVDYTYEIKPNYVLAKNNEGLATGLLPTQQRCYSKNLAGLSNMELKLIFPDKIQFIVAEMGTTFGSSVILICVVLFLSWQSIYALLKEKKIAEQTTDFISNMTHELKTPLTNIGLAGKLLLKENNINDESRVRHYLSVMLEENDKLSKQVEQVLGVSALERGEMPLDKHMVDLHGVFDEVLRSFSLQLENKGIRVVNQMQAVQTRIQGDYLHLHHAIRNLVDNAIKYSDDESEVLIKSWNVESFFYVSIQNKGTGIEKRNYKKVFEKFYRVPTGNLHNVKGFGLGLAYVKKIMDLHGGTIEVNSDKDTGTTFTLMFPNA